MEILITLALILVASLVWFARRSKKSSVIAAKRETKKAAPRPSKREYIQPTRYSTGYVPESPRSYDTNRNNSDDLLMTGLFLSSISDSGSDNYPSTDHGRNDFDFGGGSFGGGGGGDSYSSNDGSSSDYGSSSDSSSDYSSSSNDSDW